MQKQVLISGYYGCNNMGDEAVLAGLLAGLQLVAPTVQPVVLSAMPHATTALHGVASVPRSNISAVWQALRHTTGLVSGGGSLLQDVTSRRSVYYYLGVMAMAQLLRRPFCICGQGMGPLQSPMARKATGRMLQKSRSIWVRDQAAGEVVRELLAGKTARTSVAPDGTSRADDPPDHDTHVHLPSGRAIRVQVAADPAFMLTAPDQAQARQQLQELVRERFSADTPFWLVALRPWDNQLQWQPYLLQALVAAAKACQACLVFVALHVTQDQPLAEEMHLVVQAQGVRSSVLASENVHHMRTLLAGADLVIAMRLHALILAAAAGVPSVAISYDPKVTAFAQELALPCLPLARLDATGAKELAQIIGATWAQLPTVSRQLIQSVAHLRQQALSALTASIASLGLPTINDDKPL